jgi:cytochrome c5
MIMEKTAFVTIIGTALALTAVDSLAADGKEVYDKACAICHKSLPPKLTDKAAWEPRLKQGNDALVASVIKGKGTMPPRGGNAKLSDDEIKAAVDYMVTQVK